MSVLAWAHIALPAAERPNIVLIVADDLGAGDVSCYGATAVSTPHMDAVAAQGVRMTDACAAASVCQPSRYSILSGESCHRIERQGAYQTYFRPGQPTLASLAKSVGYRTALFGKWHNGFGRGGEPDWNRRNFVPATPSATSATPLDLGFDAYFGTPRSHNEPPFVFVETAQDAAGTFLRVYHGDPADPITVSPHRASPKLWNDYGHGTSSGGAAAHRARPDTQLDQILAQHVVEALQQQRPGEAPFFYYVPFTAPHVPVAPMATALGRSQAGAYGDFVMQLDDAIGMITRALQDQGLAEQTLVIITSDNGALMLGPAQHVDPETGTKVVDAHGQPYPGSRWTKDGPVHRPNGVLQGQKTDAWEGGHRVPFIVRWPAGGIPAGVVCDKLMGLTDLFATVAAIVGAPVPAGVARDSINQWPLWSHPGSQAALRSDMVILGTKGWMLRATDAHGRAWAFLPMRGTGGETVQDTDQRIPWGQPYGKLGWTNSDIDSATGMVKPDAPAWQLYDLVDDPRQEHNVVRQHLDLAVALMARMNQALALTENHPPTVTARNAPLVATVGVPVVWTVGKQLFTDQDKDGLVFAVTGLPEGLTADPLAGIVAGTPTTAGTVTCTIRADDGRGGVATATFACQVRGGHP